VGWSIEAGEEVSHLRCGLLGVGKKVSRSWGGLSKPAKWIVELRQGGLPAAGEGERRLYASAVTSASANPSYPLLPTVWIAVALTRGSAASSS
jgi:hypothetical protein